MAGSLACAVAWASAWLPDARAWATAWALAVVAPPQMDWVRPWANAWAAALALAEPEASAWAAALAVATPLPELMACTHAGAGAGAAGSVSTCVLWEYWHAAHAPGPAAWAVGKLRHIHLPEQSPARRPGCCPACGGEERLEGGSRVGGLAQAPEQLPNQLRGLAVACLGLGVCDGLGISGTRSAGDGVSHSVGVGISGAGGLRARVGLGHGLAAV